MREEKTGAVTAGTRQILVVDDEAKIVKIVQAYLERDGYTVLTAADGRTALEVARRERPSLLILDLMLPEVSGWDVCRAIRRDDTLADLPIIMLTARDETSDRIVGLELGADDYVVKPFDPNELLARVHAVLRRLPRQTTDESQVLRYGTLEIDLGRHEVRRDGAVVLLTPTEFQILAALAAHPGQVLTRQQLLDLSLGDAFYGFERTVDSHVKNLRRKLEPDPRRPSFVRTVFGVGYTFDAPV